MVSTEAHERPKAPAGNHCPSAVEGDILSMHNSAESARKQSFECLRVKSVHSIGKLDEQKADQDCGNKWCQISHHAVGKGGAPAFVHQCRAKCHLTPPVGGVASAMAISAHAASCSALRKVIDRLARGLYCDDAEALPLCEGLKKAPARENRWVGELPVHAARKGKGAARGAGASINAPQTDSDGGGHKRARREGGTGTNSTTWTTLSESCCTIPRN